MRRLWFAHENRSADRSCGSYGCRLRRCRSAGSENAGAGRPRRIRASRPMGRNVMRPAFCRAHVREQSDRPIRHTTRQGRRALRHHGCDEAPERHCHTAASPELRFQGRQVAGRVHCGCEWSPDIRLRQAWKQPGITVGESASTRRAGRCVHEVHHVRTIRQHSPRRATAASTATVVTARVVRCRTAVRIFFFTMNKQRRVVRHRTWRGQRILMRR
jgi:hypothetical protein